MRGKVDTDGKYQNADRITPAYAGKRSASRGHVEAVKDHPRLCGEKFFRSSCLIPIQGSPPPMRGKAFPAPFGGVYYGITPAYAGKSPTTF